MDAHDLTEAQLDAVHERLLPMLGYLNRLHRRMEQRGFAGDDKLLARVREAKLNPFAGEIASGDCRTTCD